MKIIQQIIRGCQTLPHVGEHPGTTTLVSFILMGGFAGLCSGNIYGFIVGVAVMSVIMIPMYLYGAYTRAMLSDKLSQEKDQ